MSRWLIPALFLLVIGTVGMLSRGDEPMPPVVVASPAPTAAAASDSWDASSVVVVGELAMEATVVGDGVVAAPAEAAWPLSRPDMLSVLRTAGWPEEWLGEALSIACGPALLRDGTVIQSGESGCDPSVTGPSPDRGLFQITPVWHDRCGVDGWELMMPLVNASCALIIVRYSESVRLPRWHYWTTSPVTQ